MALLSSDALQAVRAAWMRRRNIGSIDKADLLSAMTATDTWIDGNQASFNTALPDPFKSTATVDEKTLLFCYVALERAGLLPGNGV